MLFDCLHKHPFMSDHLSPWHAGYCKCYFSSKTMFWSQLTHFLLKFHDQGAIWKLYWKDVHSTPHVPHFKPSPKCGICDVFLMIFNTLKNVFWLYCNLLISYPNAMINGLFKSWQRFPSNHSCAISPDIPEMQHMWYFHSWYVCTCDVYHKPPITHSYLWFLMLYLDYICNIWHTHISQIFIWCLDHIIHYFHIW